MLALTFSCQNNRKVEQVKHGGRKQEAEVDTSLCCISLSCVSKESAVALRGVVRTGKCLENLQGLFKRRCWDSAKHSALFSARGPGGRAATNLPLAGRLRLCAQVSCSSQHDCLGNKQKSVFSVMLIKYLPVFRQKPVPA